MQVRKSLERKGKRMATRTIKVGALARVEGEGGMLVKIKGDKVHEVQLNIYEPPRFFEAFLRGRSYSEPPDITARICGICPVAYQMSACNAIEDAFGVKVTPVIRDLRRLLYCGEWIQSHVLHIYMLHAPDFLGYESSVHLAADFPDIVNRGLQLKKVGNEIMELVGGRAVHPINVRLGGFYKAPSKAQMLKLKERLEWALVAAKETIDWVAGFNFPDFEHNYEYVAMRHPDTYAIHEGRLVSDAGLNIAEKDYETIFEEQHVAHSNALHSVIKTRGNYFVGPQARYSLNFDKLSPLAQDYALRSGLGKTCKNPFKSILVRAVETLYAVEEAIRIIGAYEEPEKAFVDVTPNAGTGYGWSEAPRGMLYHRYTFDDAGIIQDCTIIPPTSQNQKSIEGDLHHFVSDRLDLPKEDLQWQCEQAIRNYDPCISCATHFLKLELEHL